MKKVKFVSGLCNLFISILLIYILRYNFCNKVQPNVTAEDLNLIKDLLKDILEEDNVVNDLVLRIKEKLLNSEDLLQVRKYI